MYTIVYLNILMCSFDDMLACVHPEPLSASQNEFCIFKVGVQQRFLQTTGYLYKCYVSTTLHPKLQNVTVSAKLCACLDFVSHEGRRFGEPSELIRATAQIRKMTVESRWK